LLCPIFLSRAAFSRLATNLTPGTGYLTVGHQLVSVNLLFVCLLVYICLFVSWSMPMTRGWLRCTTAIEEFLAFCLYKWNLSLVVFYEAVKFNSENSKLWYHLVTKAD